MRVIPLIYNKYSDDKWQHDKEGHTIKLQLNAVITSGGIINNDTIKLQ